MQLKKLTLDGHRVLTLKKAGLPASAPIIFLLHGLGTHAEDLASLVDEFDLPQCRFVLPDAPLSLPGYPPGAYAWYDFENPDRLGVEKSRDHLLKLMDGFASETPDAHPPVIMTGFSQGGVMALESSLAWRGGATAAVSMSGYLPHPKEALKSAKAPKKMPILLIHGTFDGVVPVVGSREAAAALKAAGYSPLLREFNMEHTITEESLEEARLFLHRILPS